MEQFEFRKNVICKWNALKLLLEEGVSYGLNLNDLLNKVESVKSSLNDGVIRIVLLGSFSDGKTSAVAGLLGRLENTMKIDNDESSDELIVYRPEGLKKGFEIIDTPGLFGTKEKEVDGKNVRFSEITEKYISEAHIVLYVCDAVTPLKDSHVGVIRRVLRDYNKLDSTIFVLNKMDEAGYDLLDEADYMKGESIKKNTLIIRLRTAINLTPDEERKLNIVCVAADPKGKGLQYWFAKSEDYIRRSRIGNLRNSINKVVEQSDSEKLQLSVSESSVKDVIRNVSQEIVAVNKPIQECLDEMTEQMSDLSADEKQLKLDLESSKKNMQENLIRVKSDLEREIRGASIETIGDVISREIGEQDGKISFYIYQQHVNSLLSECGSSNAVKLDAASIKIEKTFSKQDEMLKDAAKRGGDSLKNVKISGDQVKAARDVIAKSYKFKPWGAKNLGQNLTKWAGRIGTALVIATELYEWYHKYKENKKLQELKDAICNAINNSMADVFKLFQNDEDYYKNFAPSYMEMCKQLNERNEEIERLRQKLSELDCYKEKIKKWQECEYVEYEEIKS